MKKGNPEVQKAILEAVTNQIDSNDPPETKKTLNRLKEAGFSHDECIKMIGSAVAYELYYIMHDRQEYNEERYIKHLNNLPELPEEE